jgi:hypothetical protein
VRRSREARTVLQAAGPVADFIRMMERRSATSVRHSISVSAASLQSADPDYHDNGAGHSLPDKKRSTQNPVELRSVDKRR